MQAVMVAATVMARVLVTCCSNATRTATNFDVMGRAGESMPGRAFFAQRKDPWTAGEREDEALQRPSN